MAGPMMREIDLLLIGKTGNGKSATGNSILKRKAFKSQSNLQSVTTFVESEVSEYKNRIIKVVDSPGVGDTRMDSQQGTELVLRAMENAIALNTRGYHAFLLVVRFGGRFTQEDEDTIKFLKMIFGNDFVRKYCILLMTYGDNFENDSDDTGLTFKGWCEQQEGVFKTLYEECDKRAILFNNGTRDEEKKNAQLDLLIEMIDSLWTPGHRYRDENFKKAEEARERVMVESKEPMIRQETMTETSLILQKLQAIQQQELKEQAEPLLELLSRLEALYESIKSQDKGTGALNKLLETIDSIKRTVNDEIKFCQRLADMREKMTLEQEEEKRMLLDQIRHLDGQYKQLKAENEKGIVAKVVEVATWPLRKVAQGVDWFFK